MESENYTRQRGLSRRALVNGALVVGAFGMLKFGLPFISGLFPERLEFKELDTPKGFRSLNAGKSSVRFDPFVGLQEQEGSEISERLSKDAAFLCEELFERASSSENVIRIASFSDYNCPYCKILTRMLADLEARSDGGISVKWHEYPLLGDSSFLAAKGALAAKRQGAYLAFHQRLMRGRLLVTPEYLKELAKIAGLETEQFVLDMNGADVLREIQTSTAIARLFGFIGTPAIVVERTAVQGAIEERTLKQLIEMEREEGENRTCV